MQRKIAFFILCFICCNAFWAMAAANHAPLFHPRSLVILPQDGRRVYFEAFASAKKEIKIEICVLEDPLILQSIQEALLRGISVRTIVDRGKYETTPAEQENLATYLTANGGELHLSNPIFPRSFPKVIIIDQKALLIGTACLDSLTFAQYRDYTYVSGSSTLIEQLSCLFDNDWLYSAPPGSTCPNFNPTPPITIPHLMISPVNSSGMLVSFIQQAEHTLDVTSELLGNPTLESELAGAVSRGVKVRLISPEVVNNADEATQELQLASLTLLQEAGVDVHVTLSSQSSINPYMHARTAIADGKRIYIGSVSLSPDSITFNREAGIILRHKSVVKKLDKQFEIDFQFKSMPFAP